MKVLVVSPPTFGTHTGGAAKDIFATVDLLKKMGHEVSFYGIGTKAQDPKLIDEFAQSRGITVGIFMPDLSRWGAWLLAVVRNFAYADRASYVFGQLIEDKAFADHVSSWRPDTVMFFCSYAWPVAQFARTRGISSIFRSHNFEPGFFFEALSTVEKWSPLNWIRYMAKWKGERAAAKLSTIIATIPFEERTTYNAWKDTSRVYVLTLTYLPDALKDAGIHAGKKPLDVFFLGASYLVSFHERGARALIEDIAPRVNERAPGAFRFHICGSKLPQDLRNKCDGESVIYEDYVRDFEEFLQGMDIGAFPVWTGKSMKGKVFESLCRAFPVVIPQNCLGGYELVDGKEVLMAETREQFVEAILSLQSDDLRAVLSTGAVAFSQRHFSYEALSSTVTTILDSAQHLAPHSQTA